MLFTSKELAFAAGASSPNLFVNDIGRYNFRITAERRVRGCQLLHGSQPWKSIFNRRTRKPNDTHIAHTDIV